MNNRRATYHANQAARHSARPTLVGADGDKFIVSINGNLKSVTMEELRQMAEESNHVNGRSK